MGEGIHTASASNETQNAKTARTQNNQPHKFQWKYVIAGTAGAVLIAGAVFQVYRTRGVNAAVNSTRSGRANVSQEQEQVLAKVGNSSISYDAVARECVARYGPEVLEKMINRAIIQQACQKHRVRITKEDVEKEVITIAKRFNLDAANWYQMLQAERNLTPDQYKRDIIWPMLALKELAGSQVQITQEDVQKAFIRDYGPRVKARMIMMSNQRRITDVWNQVVKNPEEFGRVAREKSIEPTSKALDGEIPPIRRYSGNETIEKAAFKLKPGEISGIVQVGIPGQQRFVILKCEGRTKPKVDSISEVKEELITQLREEKIQIAVGETFEKLKKETEVVNHFTGVVSGGVSQTSGAYQAGSSTKRGTKPTADTRTSSRQRFSRTPASKTN